MSERVTTPSSLTYDWLSDFSWPNEDDFGADGVAVSVNSDVLTSLVGADALSVDDVTEIELFTPNVDSLARTSLVLKKLRRERTGTAFAAFYGALLDGGRQAEATVRRLLVRTSKTAKRSKRKISNAVTRLREMWLSSDSGIERSRSGVSSKALGSSTESLRSTFDEFPDVIITSPPNKPPPSRPFISRASSVKEQVIQKIWKVTNWAAKRRSTNSSQVYKFTGGEMGYVLTARLYPIGKDSDTVGKQMQIYFSMEPPSDECNCLKPVQISLLNRSKFKHYPNVTAVFDPNDKTLRPRTALQGRKVLGSCAWKNCPSMNVQLSLVNRVYTVDDTLEFAFTVLN